MSALRIERSGSFAELEDEEVEELPYLLLRELLENPKLLEPPPVVLPRLAWQGRVTLLAAPEKFGKSTLMGQGVAAVTRSQDFLGEPTSGAGALWLALDEPLGDLVRRLAGYGAREAVYIYPERPAFKDLESTIEDQQIGLVVIDTLTEFAAGLMDDMNSPMQWQPVLAQLRGIAQRTASGIVLLHHANKTTGKYRDSSQIGAGVDAIVEMYPVTQDPTVRQCRARGRTRMGDFSLRFADPWYTLEEGELPIEMRVYRAIESNPGVSTTRLRGMVGGKSTAVDAAVRGLFAKRAIEDRGDGDRHAYHTTPVSVGSGPGQGWDRPPDSELSPLGQAGSGLGQGNGQAPLSPPYIHRGGTGSGGRDIPDCELCGTPQRKTTRGMYRCPECCPDTRWAPA
jgi:hypothetical protein